MLTACTLQLPRERLPYPLTSDHSAQEVKVVAIPLPVIAASPNEGVTTGALGAFLIHNSNDEVSSLIAPQLNFNPNFGTTFTIYGAFYPHKDRSIETNLSHSSKVNEDYEVKLRDTSMLKGKLENNLFIYHFSDGSARFFGLGKDSADTAESNFAAVESGFTYSATYPVIGDLSIQLGERLRKVRLADGAINSVPSITENYDSLSAPGIGGFTAHGQKVALLYNSLDSATMPLSGLFAKVSGEWQAKRLGNSSDYLRVESELKGIFPHDENKRFITAVRGWFSQVSGSSTPFPEQAQLGGETTLRGYGKNRFTDRGLLLLNIEERIRLFRWDLFDVTADWEVAPFLDVGQVMYSWRRIYWNDMLFNPGIGIRAVVRPNIVGRMDIGYGKEGVAVFVGLGYPF